MDTEDLTSRVEEWSSQLQEEIGADKATVEAVNTFMVVAAFIAGVQAQVITFTIALPYSGLQRAANLCAFLGLVFEISGTFLGAVHSIRLQRRSINKSSRLQRLSLFKADLKTILKWYTKMLLDEKQRVEQRDGQWDEKRDEEQVEERVEERDEERVEEQDEEQDERGDPVDERRALPPGETRRRKRPHLTATTSCLINAKEVTIGGGTFVMNNTMPQPISDTPSDRDDRKERVGRVQAFFQEIENKPLSTSQGYIINGVMKVLHALSLVQGPPLPEHNNIPRQTTQLFFNTVPLAMRPMFTFGNIPLISMAIGVAFLMASTILLAAASQVVAPEVWIASTAALVIVMALSLLPFSPWILKEIISYFKPIGSITRSAA